MGIPSFEYDVALSFAGEDRAVAEELRNLLTQRGIRVFYDQDAQASLWGKDLYQHLQTIYRDKAAFCVVLISQHYVQKHWTRHELQQAQARAFAADQEYILPLRLDDTPVPGINPTTGYLDLRKLGLANVALLVCQKVGLQLKWATHQDYSVKLSEFSDDLRKAVDWTRTQVVEAILQIDTKASASQEAFLAKIAASLHTLKAHNSLDVEPMCISEAGVFVAHPMPHVGGKSLAWVWESRAGFSDWLLQSTKTSPLGYLTWLDNFSSDLATLPQLFAQNSRGEITYNRKTLLAYQRINVDLQCPLTLLAWVEGHEVADLRVGKPIQLSHFR